jgi:hypothetical protein
MDRTVDKHVHAKVDEFSCQESITQLINQGGVYQLVDQKTIGAMVLSIFCFYFIIDLQIVNGKNVLDSERASETSFGFFGRPDPRTKRRAPLPDNMQE